MMYVKAPGASEHVGWRNSFDPDAANGHPQLQLHVPTGQSYFEFVRNCAEVQRDVALIRGLMCEGDSCQIYFGDLAWYENRSAFIEACTRSRDEYVNDTLRVAPNAELSGHSRERFLGGTPQQEISGVPKFDGELTTVGPDGHTSALHPDKCCANDFRVLLSPGGGFPLAQC